MTVENGQVDTVSPGGRSCHNVNIHKSAPVEQTTLCSETRPKQSSSNTLSRRKKKGQCSFPLSSTVGALIQTDGLGIERRKKTGQFPSQNWVLPLGILQRTPFFRQISSNFYHITVTVVFSTHDPSINFPDDDHDDALTLNEVDFPSKTYTPGKFSSKDFWPELL